MSGRASMTALGLVLSGGLASCATFGGNVKGSFSCGAPEGRCAPTSVVDDQALAMIAGEGTATTASPVRSVASSAPRSDRLTTPSSTRTGERILRIVLPAYVDEAGRLHETAAVRAVVEPGRWGPAFPSSAQAQLADQTLVGALERPEALERASASADPGLPDPAAVSAARARLDPVGAIKAEVDAHLARMRSPEQAADPARSSDGTVADRSVPNADRKPPLAPKASTIRSAGFPAGVVEEER